MSTRGRRRRARPEPPTEAPLTARGPLRRVLHLPPEPQSSARARGFVRALLLEADRESWGEAASLAVSELVTNAVLHGHSDIEVVGEVTEEHVRLEVRDGNPTLPAARSYDDHATTGRGLELVAGVTQAHGVESLGAAGKVVWCCVGDPPSDDELDADVLLAEWDDSLELTGNDDAARGGAGSDDAVAVRLREVPATLWLAAREHHDALLRELALQRASSGAAATVDVAAVDAARAVLDTAVDAELDRARRAGEASVPLPEHHPGALPAVPGAMELELRVRRGEAAAFAWLQDLLDEGERRAAADELLLRPALPEIVAVRDWACEQVIAQVAGSPAAAWTGADDERFTRDVRDVTTSGWDDAQVRQAAGGAIAVDDSNRVIAVSAPLADLLGWSADDLVGRRVVAIVPPRYREAHVAGFSRHLSTGEARALGVELELPVLCADGSEIACRFLIDSTAGPGGRTAYIARITPVEQRADGPDHSLRPG